MQISDFCLLRVCSSSKRMFRPPNLFRGYELFARLLFFQSVFADRYLLWRDKKEIALMGPWKINRVVKTFSIFAFSRKTGSSVFQYFIVSLSKRFNLTHLYFKLFSLPLFLINAISIALLLLAFLIFYKEFEWLFKIFRSQIGMTKVKLSLNEFLGF